MSPTSTVAKRQRSSWNRNTAAAAAGCAGAPPKCQDHVVPRIVDTTPTFEDFARKAFLESPGARELLWKKEYEGAHSELFAAFHATQESDEGRSALVRELSNVRAKAKEAGVALRELIGEIEPKVCDLLGLGGEPAPLHVLLVGTYSTNAVVGRVGDDVALFHCVEWYRSREGARTLIAHESTHAWHQLALGAAPPDDDPAWVAFYEGLAVQASRAAVPATSEHNYFWYGLPGFEEWLDWCREHRDRLLERFREGIDDPRTADAFFGGGLVEGRWRVGFFLADELVAGLGRPLPELLRMSVDEGRATVRTALGLD